MMQRITAKVGHQKQRRHHGRRRFGVDSAEYLVGRTLNNRWRIGFKMEMSCGAAMHNAIDLYTGAEVTMKAVGPRGNMNLLIRELEIYKVIQGRDGRTEVGIPRMYDYGFELQHCFMIVDLVGPSLEEVFRRCKWRLSLKAVVAIASQVLCRLQALHARGVVHGNVNPRTLRMGENDAAPIVYIVDFCASHHVTGPMRPDLRGAPRLTAYDVAFQSVEVSDGEEPSAKDDLESFAYVLVYLITGRLPWLDFRAIDHHTDIHAVRTLKAVSSLEHMCTGLPDEIEDYLTYCRCSHPDQSPNYNHLRTMFGQMYLRINGSYEPPTTWRANNPISQPTTTNPSMKLKRSFSLWKSSSSTSAARKRASGRLLLRSPCKKICP